MNLVCDQAVQRPIVEQLREHGHHVLYVAELDLDIDDDVILEPANALHAPLVTTDKDFGELVFRQGLSTAGVVLIRLAGLSNTMKAQIVAAAIRDHAGELRAGFMVISAGPVWIRRVLP